MTEGFDKEAERERLRKKYEDDRADREVTERMSELLLQGATMTNKHCNRCGSPIFRYQDQEFCPTCQTDVEAAEAGDENALAESASSESAAADSAGDEETATPVDSGAETTTADTAGTDTMAAESTDSTESKSGPTGGAGAARDTGEVSLDEATRTLVRTIATLSERAERAEDPRRAKDLLAAAREAAETLATLRGGN